MRQLIIRNLDGVVVGGISCGDKGEIYIKGETAELEGLLRGIVDNTQLKSNKKISELLCSNGDIEYLEGIKKNLEGYGFKGIFTNDAKEISGYYRGECNRIAVVYDFLVRLMTLPFGGGGKLRDSVIELLNPQPADKILDVCCGTGELTKMVSERVGEVGEVVGIDLSPNMLSIARRKTTGVCFIHANSENIPYPANYFDRITISFALHEMPRIARSNTLKEIYRILRNDGKLLVADYHKPEGFLRNTVLNIAMLIETDTAKDMINHGLRKELANNGFQIEQSKLMAMGLIEAILARKVISS